MKINYPGPGTSSLDELIEKIEAEIMIQLLPKDKDDERNSFVELRAGAGEPELAGMQGTCLRKWEGGKDGMTERSKSWRQKCYAKPGFEQAQWRWPGAQSAGRQGRAGIKLSW